VFVAKDRESSNRLVAIKKVVVMDNDPDKKRLFQKESEIMKQLDHPHICKLLETYDQGKFMFFVMEYCAGQDVFDHIQDNDMIDEGTTADIIRQTASALRYAHSMGIAHRDIKPENVVFCNNDADCNDIKVIDWGVGYFFGSGRMTSAVGSMAYAGPEVLQASKGYTSACDAWSLGVMTYVMLCGKPPFWGNHKQQLRAMKKETYPISDETWQEVSVAAKDMVQKLLKAKPDQRLTMDEVLNHPWLTGSTQKTENKVSKKVLCNLKNFTHTSDFVSICVASVARQLDHNSLRDVHRVFSDMDENGDGVLELDEVKAGFQKILGDNSPDMLEIEAMFQKIDLDGSGKIDYSEFCAAGVGERCLMEEDVLWAAFKAFDVEDDDGQLTKDEIIKVLNNADVNEVWTKQVCDEAFADFDKNRDGKIDFDEWLQFMRQVAQRHKDASPTSPKEQELLIGLASASLDVARGRVAGLGQAMDILGELDAKPKSRSATLTRTFSENVGLECCASPRDKDSEEGHCILL